MEKHIYEPLMGGDPTNKNYDSDIFKKQSTPKLLRDKHTKLTFMHVATMIMFFKRKNIEANDLIHSQEK